MTKITNVSVKACDAVKARLEQKITSYYMVPIKILVNEQVQSEVFAIFIRTQKENGNSIKTRFFTFKTSVEDALDECTIKTDYIKKKLGSEFDLYWGTKIYSELLKIAKEVAKTI